MPPPPSPLRKIIGMSGRSSSRSAFGRLNGNDINGHYFQHFSPLFFFNFSYLVYFSQRRRCYRQRGVAGGEALQVLQAVRRCSVERVTWWRHLAANNYNKWHIFPAKIFLLLDLFLPFFQTSVQTWKKALTLRRCLLNLFRWKVLDHVRLSQIPAQQRYVHCVQCYSACKTKNGCQGAPK